MTPAEKIKNHASLIINTIGLFILALPDMISDWFASMMRGRRAAKKLSYINEKVKIGRAIDAQDFALIKTEKKATELIIPSFEDFRREGYTNLQVADYLRLAIQTQNIYKNEFGHATTHVSVECDGKRFKMFPAREAGKVRLGNNIVQSYESTALTYDEVAGALAAAKSGNVRENETQAGIEYRSDWAEKHGTNTQRPIERN